MGVTELSFKIGGKILSSKGRLKNEKVDEL